MAGASARGRPSGLAAPLTEAEAAELFGRVEAVDTLVLAVSGGPDSIALMHFAAACGAAARRRGAPFPRLAVTTVDHGLRPGSRREAEQVMARAAGLGLHALLLTWEGEKPGSRIQEEARRHRYALLFDAARQFGATHLATAHTLDDQAETILFRMARGSGPTGLSGMRSSAPRNGLVHVRPFLGTAKSRLVGACRVNGWDYVDDPSNHDPRFARTRLRTLLPLMAAEGLDARRFETLARRLAEADEVVALASRRALAEASMDAPCPATFRAARLMQEPAAVLHRAIEAMLSDVAQPGRPMRRGPRLEQVEALATALRQAWVEARPFRRNLRGKTLTYDGALRLTIAPEAPRRLPSFGGGDRL